MVRAILVPHPEKPDRCFCCGAKINEPVTWICHGLPCGCRISMCSGCRDDRTDELTIVTEMSRFERQLPSKIEGTTAAQGDLARTREQRINIDKICVRLRMRLNMMGVEAL